MAYIFCSFIQNELRGNFLMGFLIIQLRDRPKDNSYYPFENTDISDVLIKPGTMLQHNWFKL